MTFVTTTTSYSCLQAAAVCETGEGHVCDFAAKHDAVNLKLLEAWEQL